MTEPQNTPELRFPEFEGEWTEYQFQSHLSKIETGTNKLRSEDFSGLPLLKMGNIQRGNFTFNKLEKLKKDEVVNNEHLIQNKDFLFNTLNTMELVGKSATWIGESNKFAFNSNIARLTLENMDTVFFNYLYNTTKMIHKVKSLAVGTTSVAAIYPRDLRKLKYFVPIFDEQLKIGEFFSKLDRQIELEEEKLELLEQQKKGYIQKIFSQELRFKDENGNEYPNWKTKKLDNVATINRGLTYKPSDIRQKGVRVLRSSNIVNDKFHTYEDDIFVDENVVKIPLANEEDILITAANGSPKLVGKHALIKALKQDSVAGGFMYLLKSKNTKFIQIWMNTKEYKKIINKVQGGNGSIGNLSRKDLENGIITMPCLEEQEKIGLFFSKIDVQIEVLVNKIRNLKERKQGLLQKMFM